MVDEAIAGLGGRCCWYLSHFISIGDLMLGCMDYTPFTLGYTLGGRSARLRISRLRAVQEKHRDVVGFVMLCKPRHARVIVPFLSITSLSCSTYLQAFDACEVEKACGSRALSWTAPRR